MSSPQSPQTLQEEHGSEVVADSQPQTIEEEPSNENHQDHIEAIPFTDLDNPENDEQEEEEEEEEEEPEEEAVVFLEQENLEANSAISSGMPSQLADVSTHSSSQRVSNKRKKGKGKGKGKPNAKKLQMLEKKIQSLTQNLNPVPFIPLNLDFPKHETLLRNLGLWDFIKIDFGKKPNKDLIVQLVANYESRYSHVNGSQIGVNRADLSRAFKMPTKKEKDNSGVNLDVKPLSQESIAFVEEFVLNWMLLHDGTWMMPNEVRNWLKVIKEGHPEKVDWAGLIWFMMEKELAQGENLKNCYYAAHFQHLMKEQKVYLKEEEAELAPVVKKVEAEDLRETDAKADDVTELEEGPSIELTLGEDVENGVKMQDMEMVDFEKCKEEDGGEGEEQGKWVDEKVELELDEEKFHDFANDDNALDEDGLTDNFLEAMNEDQIDFTSHVGPSEIRMDSHPSFFNQAGKRVIQQENLINKWLRMNDSWEDNNKQPDFGMCMEDFQKNLSNLGMLYEQKQQAIEESKLSTQMLLAELQKREDMIEHLNKTRYEEVQKKDKQIHRYEKELFVMGNILDGYKKVVKAAQKQFDEYRKKIGLPEEPAYKIGGPGGLMLSVGEIERNQKKQEEEYRNKCLGFEHECKEMEKRFASQFDLFFEKVGMLDKKLVGLEVNAKELIGLYAEQKVPRIDEHQVSKASSDEFEEHPGGEKAKSDEIDEHSINRGEESKIAQNSADE